MYVLISFVTNCSEFTGAHDELIKSEIHLEPPLPRRNNKYMYASFLTNGKFISAPFSQQKYLNLYIQANFLAKIWQPENTSPEFTYTSVELRGGESQTKVKPPCKYNPTENAQVRLSFSPTLVAWLAMGFPASKKSAKEQIFQ